MFSTRFTLSVVAACVFTAAAALAQGPTPLVTQTQDQLITVLKSDAARKAKADACRELAVIGGKDAVPVLVGLLASAEMNHMARYALETMPDPAVTDALRGELGKLKGLQLVGVIGSLGVRKDGKAVETLSALLSDGDVEVVRASARALGSIGTPAAADALMAGVGNASEATFMDYADGLGRVAEALVAQGQVDMALSIYDHYNDPNLPQQVRAEALRGAILARKEKGIPIMREAMNSGDYILFAAAVRAAQEMPGPAVTAALCAELGKFLRTTASW
jgi:HEAT repeat protein